jgi:hypothetical protein
MAAPKSPFRTCFQVPKLEQELASGACDGTAESLRQLAEFLRT